jgi:predicted MPP superfamily phosphohydrolase
MFKDMMRWLRDHVEPGAASGSLARLIGRSWARLTYATKLEPHWLEVNEHDIPISDLPDPFHGLKIVQLSDLHCGGHVTPAYLNEAVDLAMGQGADVIVLTGDFIHKGFKHVEDVAEVLARLTCPHGVYAVLGNHDYSIRNALGWRRYEHLHRAVAEALTEKKIRVLHNETVPLIRGDAKLHLSGVADLWSRLCDIDQTFTGICSKIPRVVLAHNPLTIEHFGEQRCDLMLSGHTHGGQINLPGLGRITLTRNAKRLAAGLYAWRNTLIYVNKGVGFGFRLRYGVRPEVAVLTLRQAKRTNGVLTA